MIKVFSTYIVGYKQTMFKYKLKSSSDIRSTVNTKRDWPDRHSELLLIPGIFFTNTNTNTITNTNTNYFSSLQSPSSISPSTTSSKNVLQIPFSQCLGCSPHLLRLPSPPTQTPCSSFSQIRQLFSFEGSPFFKFLLSYLERLSATANALCCLALCDNPPPSPCTTQFLSDLDCLCICVCVCLFVFVFVFSFVFVFVFVFVVSPL